MMLGKIIQITEPVVDPTSPNTNSTLGIIIPIVKVDAMIIRVRKRNLPSGI